MIDAQKIQSKDCPLAGEEWHDDKWDDRYRECCDHAPLGPVERKAVRRVPKIVKRHWPRK